MPKMKTHSGAKKRFKLTGTGKLKRGHAYTSHLKRKKSKKAKRALSHSVVVHPHNEKTLKRLLCL